MWKEENMCWGNTCIQKFERGRRGGRENWARYLYVGGILVREKIPVFGKNTCMCVKREYLCLGEETCLSEKYLWVHACVYDGKGLGVGGGYLSIRKIPLCICVCVLRENICMWRDICQLEVPVHKEKLPV